VGELPGRLRQAGQAFASNISSGKENMKIGSILSEQHTDNVRKLLVETLQFD
jgi:hypothetical protein